VYYLKTTQTTVMDRNETESFSRRLMDSPNFNHDIRAILVARLPLSPAVQMQAGCIHEKNLCSFASEPFFAVRGAFSDANPDEEVTNKITVLISRVGLRILLYFGLRVKWYTL
jgi:hypothetical protein